MSGSAPEVLQGTRAPRTVRLEEAQKRAAEAKPIGTPVLAADYNTYVSYGNGRRYRVQITAPQTLVLADGRKQSGGKMIVVEFDDHVYRNNHKDLKVRKLIDEELQRNPYFGHFGSPTAHFWLASEQEEVMAKARLDGAMATLKSLPKEVVDRFVGELAQGTADDHVPPAAK